MRYGTQLSSGEIVLAFDVFESLKGCIKNSFVVLAGARTNYRYDPKTRTTEEVSREKDTIAIVIPKRLFKPGMISYNVHGQYYGMDKLYWVDAEGTYTKMCSMCPGFIKCSLSEWKSGCHLGAPDFEKGEYLLPLNEQYCDFSSINILSEKRSGADGNHIEYVKLDKPSIEKIQKEINQKSKLAYARKKHRDNYCSHCVCYCKPAKADAMDRVISNDDFRDLLKGTVEIRFGTLSRLNEMFFYTYDEHDIKSDDDIVNKVAPWIYEFTPGPVGHFSIVPFDRFTMLVKVSACGNLTRSELLIPFDLVKECTREITKPLNAEKFLLSASYLFRDSLSLLRTKGTTIREAIQSMYRRSSYIGEIRLPIFDVNAKINGIVLNNRDLQIQVFCDLLQNMVREWDKSTYKTPHNRFIVENSYYGSSRDRVKYGDAEFEDAMRKHRLPQNR